MRQKKRRRLRKDYRDIRCHENSQGQLRLDMIDEWKSIECDPTSTFEEDVWALRSGKLAWKKWSELDRPGDQSLIAVWEKGRAYTNTNYRMITPAGKRYLGFSEDATFSLGERLF